MESQTILEAVAEHAYAYPYRIWGFGEGPGLLGMIAASDLLGDDLYLRRVDGLVAPWLSAPRRPEDHAASAEMLLALAQRTEHNEPREAAEEWADLVVGADRPVPACPQVHRPDLELWSTQVWVDCLHTDGPGLAALGRTSEAITIVEENSAALQDPCGLFCHGFDVSTGLSNGIHWGRGCGWALWGLVGTLSFATDERLSVRLSRLLNALSLYEEGGRWRTIVDDRDSPYEASISSLVAASIFAGLRDGVLDEERRPLAESALKAALIETVGGGLPVSEATPVGRSEIYKTRSTGVFPWGQGPLLLALAAAEGWTPLSPNSNPKKGPL